MSDSFWHGKKVFITGHTGFKGGWLTFWLKLLGASVTGYSLAPMQEPNFFSLTKIADNISSTIGDILNQDLLTQTLQEVQPEIILHLAAQPLVRYSYDNPIETYAVNVMGTAHLLEAARKLSNLKAIVVVTSDKCYENQEWLWGYRESDPMGGYDPYSSSKGCTELVVSAYRRSYFNEKNIALASVRAGNVIGGGDWAKNRLVPDLMRAFANHEVAALRHPHAYRPWQHILDLLTGYLLLTKRLYQEGLNFAGPWNFGPSEENIISVGDVADLCAKFWGDDAKWQTVEARTLHEAILLKLDCNKSRALLGWSPRWNIQNSLKATVEWYRAFTNEEDMFSYTTQQIQQFEHSVD